MLSPECNVYFQSNNLSVIIQTHPPRFVLVSHCNIVSYAIRPVCPGEGDRGMMLARYMIRVSVGEWGTATGEMLKVLFLSSPEGIKQGNGGVSRTGK